jgi:hypothetical protein
MKMERTIAQIRHLAVPDSKRRRNGSGLDRVERESESRAERAKAGKPTTGRYLWLVRSG